jgi:hypothetical protein
VFLTVGAIAMSAALLLYVSPEMETPAAPETSMKHQEARVNTERFESVKGDKMQISAQPRVRAPEEMIVSANPPAETNEGEGRDAVSAVLELPESNEQVAGRLLAMMPSLSTTAQVEAAQHMVNLLDDANYQPALNMLLGQGTPREIQQVIYADLLNRPNNLKLPALLSVLRVPGHQLQPEALETLRIFIGQDYGADATAWNQAVTNFLQKEAEEEASLNDSGVGLAQ